MAEISEITKNEIINGATDRYLLMFRDDNSTPHFPHNWSKFDYKTKISILQEALSKECLMVDTDTYKATMKKYENDDSLGEESDAAGIKMC